ncbi:hypothetical protein A3Q56_08483 [Intoshia linei]|uniref:Uncharacterized protein n=1 Tax=Intoshia linei TaxID=1819745 RepID=A0A177AQY4_9BILA|nr:hypothetical protein A3Q56_08483 [Intoshia linei]
MLKMITCTISVVIILILKIQSFTLKPILIFPGYAGTKLEARLTNMKSKHWYCNKNSDWFLIWFNIFEELPFKMNCFKEIMTIHYNNKNYTHGTNTPGVEIRVFNDSFGRLDAIEKISYYDFENSNLIINL